MKAPRESIIPVFVPHFGCPNDCVFCNQRRISGEQEPATEQTVIEAVQRARELLPEGSCPQLAFYGGSFTAIPMKEQLSLLETAKKFLDEGVISSIRLSTRPDAIDGEILKYLKEYGVETIELGAQSLDDSVLLLAGRGHTAEDVVKASYMIKEAGFRLILQMMTGLPGDSEEKSIETAKKIIALRPGGVRVYPTVIVRDTVLYDLWKEGRYAEHSVEDAVSVCSKLLPMFDEAGIPVIRLGLNPTDELSAGSAVGGAYHPALGELVKSRIMRNEAEKLLSGVEEETDVVIGVNESRLSQMIGQHRSNIEYLENLFNLHSLSIKSADVLNNEVKLISIEKNRNL